MAEAAAQVRKQVEQMKQFILSEAEERAHEIVEKAKSEAEARKQEDIKRGKGVLESAFKKNMEELKTQQRVAEAKAKKTLEDSVLESRVDATDSVRDASARALTSMTQNQGEYRKLLLQLTVQAAYALEGPAKVSVRKEDQGLLDLKAAAQEAEQLLKESGRPRKITLKIDSEELPADRLGGVFLTLDGGDVEIGGITCDNTLASRLATCLEEYAPVLRRELFA
eukprot:Hpha_TRINITY_DN21024_c0_g1::TRINITY_DN21024_c0_g1_i1::g.103385::m.103385/K02150/ATPeV1E, ATP6E; V-type H+-transporting ATPase subunit E